LLYGTQHYYTPGNGHALTFQFPYHMKCSLDVFLVLGPYKSQFVLFSAGVNYTVLLLSKTVASTVALPAKMNPIILKLFTIFPVKF